MASEGLSGRIETVESSYEYLLAYAAQGRQHDLGSEARARLQALAAALDGLGDDARAAIDSQLPDAARTAVAPYLDAVERDAAIARGAVTLVLAREAISSLLVDNLNASVHLRALLTDVFLIEQSLKSSSRDRQ